MRGKNLKRSLLCFAMVFSIVFSLCGCKNDNAEEEEATAETTILSTQAAEQATLQSQSEKEETTVKTTAQTTEETTTAQTTTSTTAQTTEETTTAQTTTAQTTTATTRQTTVKTTQTTKQTTAKTTTTTEEEEAMEVNMPEIVFIMSLNYFIDKNIFGYFVTNTGEVKMFDFEPIAPGEFYDVQDVYDRLDEAVCDEFPKDIWREFSFDGEPITNDELVPVPKEELKEKYKALLSIDKNGNIETYENELSGEGGYSAYGVRYNQDHDKEIILLHGKGKYVYEREDEIPNEIYRWLKREAFPMFPFFS